MLHCAVYSLSSSTCSLTLSQIPFSNFLTLFQKHRPSPIALEPCVGNRAAVLSLVVRLPTGGKPFTPNGYTGIAVASSLVTLGTFCVTLRHIACHIS